MAVNGSALNGEGTVTLTWTNADKVTVKQGTTVLSSGQAWDLPNCPSYVTVTGSAASGDFHDVHFEMEYSGHGVSVTDRVWMSVIGIQWMQLGKPASLGKCTIGEVFLPDYYGGYLTLNGGQSSVYYMAQDPGDYDAAVSIEKGEKEAKASGSPCIYDAPPGDIDWYYVAVDSNTTLTASLEQKRDLKDPVDTDHPWMGGIGWQPWACSYYPFAKSVDLPHLYDVPGPLSKYDHEFGANSLEVEKTGLGYSAKHYYPESPLLESDAERTVGYDFNQNGNADDANVEYDFWNGEPAYNDWVGAVLYPPGSPPIVVPPEDPPNTTDVVPITWWGHCGQATAAIIYEKPPENTFHGQHEDFSLADKKGLLVALYHFGSTSEFLLKGPDLLPGTWHRWLTKYILKPNGNEHPIPFACDTKNTGPGVDEIWNYPIYAIVSLSYTQNDNDAAHPWGYGWYKIDCKVDKWDFEHGQLAEEDYQYYVDYPGVTGNPSDGSPGDWITALNGRPDSVWMPTRQSSISNWWQGQLGQVQLDYANISSIIPIQQQGNWQW